MAEGDKCSYCGGAGGKDHGPGSGGGWWMCVACGGSGREPKK